MAKAKAAPKKKAAPKAAPKVAPVTVPISKVSHQLLAQEAIRQLQASGKSTFQDKPYRLLSEAKVESLCRLLSEIT